MKNFRVVYRWVSVAGHKHQGITHYSTWEEADFARQRSISSENWAVQRKKPEGWVTLEHGRAWNVTGVP